MATVANFIQELNITDDIEKCGVTRLAKENSRILLECNKAGKPVVIIFSIHDNELFATLEDFEDRSTKCKVDYQTQEAIKYCLSKNYVDLLSKSNGKTSTILEEGDKDAAADPHQHEEEENEYTQDIEILSVELAIRKNAGRFAVPGMIIGLSSVEQVVTHTQFECSNCKYSLLVRHNPPLFSLSLSL